LLEALQKRRDRSTTSWKRTPHRARNGTAVIVAANGLSTRKRRTPSGVTKEGLRKRWPSDLRKDRLHHAAARPREAHPQPERRFAAQLERPLPSHIDAAGRAGIVAPSLPCETTDRHERRHVTTV